jgi:hypothetical protein
VDCQLRHVDGLACATRMKGLMPAAVMKNQQVVTVYQGDADTVGQQGVGEVVGQLPHATVEESHQIMAGMKPIQSLILFHQQAIAQPIMLAENDRLRYSPQRLVNLGMGDVTLAQT